MKKIIILIVLITLLSGCTVEYNVTINDTNFSESTRIITDTSKNPLEEYHEVTLQDYFDLNQNTYYEPVYFNSDTEDYPYIEYQEGVEYYEISPYKHENLQGINLNYNFQPSQYYRSSIIKKAYKEFNTQLNDDIYSLRTSNKCVAFENYPLLETIVINVTIDYEIISSNADSINGNVHTWVITKDNYQNKPIRIIYDSVDNELQKAPVKENSDSEKKDNIEEIKIKENNNFIIIIISFVAFILILIIIIMQKKKRL